MPHCVSQPPDSAAAPPVKVKDAPAFDFYPERWIAGTRHMTKEEKSDYLELLCVQWLEDGLPDDLTLMARIVGHRKAAQLSPLVREKFPLGSGGRRRNARLEKERTDQRARIAKNRKGAYLTNAKRWNSDSPEHRSATPQRPESDIACDSPPPTTHPKDNNNDKQWSSPTLEFAEGFAEAQSIQAEVCRLWFSRRSIVGWLTVQQGVQVPIVSWREDLREFNRQYLLREAQQAGGQKKGAAPKREPVALDLPTEGQPLFPCIDALTEWLKHKRERGEAYKPSGWAKMLRKLSAFDVATVRAAIDQSMANNWQGLFLERLNGPSQKKWGGAGAEPTVKRRSHGVDVEPEGDWRTAAAALAEQHGWQIGDLEHVSWRSLPADVRGKIQQRMEEKS